MKTKGKTLQDAQAAMREDVMELLSKRPFHLTDLPPQEFNASMDAIRDALGVAWLKGFDFARSE